MPLPGERTLGYIERARAKVRARRAAGLCVDCGIPAWRGSLCEPHWRRSMASMRARRIQLEKRGLCIRCGENRPNGEAKQCEECLKLMCLKAWARLDRRGRKRRIRSDRGARHATSAFAPAADHGSSARTANRK